MFARRPILSAGLAFALLAITAAPFAQTFPNRPIRIVLPQPAGTGPDVIARALAEELAADLGQPVVIENRPGANGSVAATYVVSHPADGHTLFLAGVSTMAWNPFLYKKLSYNPLADLMGVALIGNTRFMTVVSPSLGVNSLPELIRKAKAEPGRISFASAGIGNSTHLSTELLKMRTGIDMQHVPFSGSGGATMYSGVLSGDPQLLTSVPSDLVPLAKAGKVIALAVTGEKRLPELPDVPTFKELGIDMEVPGWYAIVARAGVPAAVIDRLNQAINKAVGGERLQQAMNARMIEPVTAPPLEIERLVKRDSESWGPIITRLNIAN